MAQASIADILDRAADLIEPEGAWTQHHYARNDRGTPFIHCSRYPDGPASCFCANGAINVAAGNRPTEDYTPATNFFADMFFDGASGDWNDAPDRTQAEVVAKLREAAKLARAGAA